MWSKNLEKTEKTTEVNVPNGKSTQIYHFQKPYEAKHAIGVKHSKRSEFLSREGINKIDLVGQQMDSMRGSRYDSGTCTGFYIQGKPQAVDKLMV